jgi:hypothetical protein
VVVPWGSLRGGKGKDAASEFGQPRRADHDPTPALTMCRPEDTTKPAALRRKPRKSAPPGITSPRLRGEIGIRA